MPPEVKVELVISGKRTIEEFVRQGGEGLVLVRWLFEDACLTDTGKLKVGEKARLEVELTTPSSLFLPVKLQAFCLPALKETKPPHMFLEVQGEKVLSRMSPLRFPLLEGWTDLIFEAADFYRSLRDVLSDALLNLLKKEEKRGQEESHWLFGWNDLRWEEL